MGKVSDSQPHAEGRVPAHPGGAPAPKDERRSAAIEEGPKSATEAFDEEGAGVAAKE